MAEGWRYCKYRYILSKGVSVSVAVISLTIVKTKRILWKTTASSESYSQSLSSILHSICEEGEEAVLLLSAVETIWAYKWPFHLVSRTQCVFNRIGRLSFHLLLAFSLVGLNTLQRRCFSIETITILPQRILSVWQNCLSVGHRAIHPIFQPHSSLFLVHPYRVDEWPGGQ